MPGPVNFALFACIWSAIAEPGPMVKASVGSVLGPQFPERVPSLTMRQNPPVTVTGRGFSIVTVGGDDALTTVAIVITTAPTALTLFFFVMVNRIVRGLTDGFNLSHSCPSRPPRPSSPPIAFPKNQVKRETAALHPTWKGRFTAGTNPSTL